LGVGIDDAYLGVLQQYNFDPASLDGKNVASVGILEVSFETHSGPN
jgi:hypothetical protein